MEFFIRKPQIDFFEGVRVTKDTVLEYKTDSIDQTVKDLLLHTVSRVKGDGYEAKTETTVYLKEGDVLIFEKEGRGYIKPLDYFTTVEEAIDDLLNIKDLGKENVNVSN